MALANAGWWTSSRNVVSEKSSRVTIGKPDMPLTHLSGLTLAPAKSAATAGASLKQVLPGRSCVEPDKYSLKVLTNIDLDQLIVPHEYGRLGRLGRAAGIREPWPAAAA